MSHLPARWHTLVLVCQKVAEGVQAETEPLARSGLGSFIPYVPVGASLWVPPEMSQSKEDSTELTSTSQEAWDATGSSRGVQLPLQAGGLEGFWGEVTPGLMRIKT